MRFPLAVDEMASSGSLARTVSKTPAEFNFEGPQLLLAESRQSMANPNPSTAHLKKFPKGKSGNPGGKSKEQVAIERRNAQKAMEIREKLLSVMADTIDDFLKPDESGSMPEKGKVLAFVEASALKLLKDAEDRGLGAPIQDVRSGDGSMTPKSMIDPTKMSEAALAELLNASTDET